MSDQSHYNDHQVAPRTRTATKEMKTEAQGMPQGEHSGYPSLSISNFTSVEAIIVERPSPFMREAQIIQALEDILGENFKADMINTGIFASYDD